LVVQEGVVAFRIGASTEVAKPQVFDRALGKVSGFITVYKLFLRMRMKGDTVKEQIQWIVIYIRRISRCLEKECIGMFGVKKFGV